MVPFLNLVRPKQIMNDLWRATDPKMPVQPGIAWKQVRVPLLVHAWWLLFLLSVAVGIVASNLRQEASTLHHPFISVAGAEPLRRRGEERKTFRPR